MEESYCTFIFFAGPNKASYDIQFDAEDLFWYNDLENKQFVVEIYGQNDIHLTIILENLQIKKHDFSRERHLEIDLAKNAGED